MRFGLIGFGAWGYCHAAAIARTPEAELVAIASRSPANRDKAAALYPGVKLVADHGELLRRPEVDIVDIVLPIALHEEAAIAAFEAGKHVLLEKPMAHTVEACDRILAAAARAGRMLNIAHEFRLSSQWGRIKELIDAGRLGEPMAITIDLFRRPFRTGGEGWRYDPARVGSWILEEPCHFVDLATWYFESLGNPVSIVGATNSKGRPDRLYDNMAMLLRWPGGPFAAITQTLGGFEDHKRIGVVCTKGSVRAEWSGWMDRTDRPTLQTLRLLEGLSGAETFDIPETCNVALETPSGEVFELEAEIRRVMESVRTGKPYVSGAEGRRAVAICLAAEEAARVRRELPLQL